jgi:hypothetical protein
MTKGDVIRAKAIDILGQAAEGLRWSELVKRVGAELPEMAENTIQGSLWNLDVIRPKDVYKPARGHWQLVKFKPTEAEKDIIEAEASPRKVVPQVNEEAFYTPFAEWIKNELEECTKAVSLGGNKFKDRWGTPDVIGIRKSKAGDILQFPTEIVSVEIKLDSSALITAFGQACSYKLFSHKSYLVVPDDSSEGDLARLDAICRIFGIGLILYDSKSPEKPDFQIRVRATKHEPDMFYVNKNMKLVEDELFG